MAAGSTRKIFGLGTRREAVIREAHRRRTAGLTCLDMPGDYGLDGGVLSAMETWIAFGWLDAAAAQPSQQTDGGPTEAPPGGRDPMDGGGGE